MARESLKSHERDAPMRLPTVMLADDHVVFTEGVVRLLGDRFDVVGTVADGIDLADAVRRLHPDVVVMDISMPRLSGLEALRRMRASHNDSRVIILTMHADARLAAEALRSGAKGFVLKHSSGQELVDAIDAVLQGRTYLTPALTEGVLALMSGPADPAEVELSPRQREILRLIVNGQRVKEIASTLDLSPRTVESVKYEMMRTLNLHSTAELVKYALEHRLVMF
jgi:DNA-binding NarL/FixJ family response regulator